MDRVGRAGGYAPTGIGDDPSVGRFNFESEQGGSGGVDHGHAQRVATGAQLSLEIGLEALLPTAAQRHRRQRFAIQLQGGALQRPSLQTGFRAAVVDVELLAEDVDGRGSGVDGDEVCRFWRRGHDPIGPVAQPHEGNVRVEENRMAEQAHAQHQKRSPGSGLKAEDGPGFRGHSRAARRAGPPK